MGALVKEVKKPGINMSGIGRWASFVKRVEWRATSKAFEKVKSYEVHIRLCSQHGCDSVDQ